MGDRAMTTTRQVAHVKVDAHGRIVIPAEFREALGLQPGHRVTLALEDGRLVLKTVDRILHEIREELEHYITPGGSMVDELIAERRAENAREERELEQWRASREQEARDE
jgi:antitoxin PrlF